MAQYDLFPISILPEGFVYHPDFLAVEEEARLLSSIRSLEFRTFDFHGYKAKRRVIMYGWDYDFASRTARAGRPLPDFLLPLRSRAAGMIGVPENEIGEALITEYPPGAPIGWHRDAPQFEVIMGVSLLGSCRLRLKALDAETKIVSIDVEPRSFYILAGPSRWNFQHSIPPVKELRYSITLRTLRNIRGKNVG